MVTARFDGRHLLGRQVAALGTAMVDNAAAGRGTLERLHFPLGPFALELDQRDGRRVLRPSVDVYDVLLIGQAAAEEDLRLDWARTLTHGAVIFQGCCRVLNGRGVDGLVSGSIVQVEEATPGMLEQILDHELTHVMQRDLINRVWFYPLERRIARALLPGDAWPEEVRLGLLYPNLKGAVGAHRPFRGLLAPLEVEAEWMEWRHR